MLVDTFYSIKEASSDQSKHIYDIELNPKHPIFSGHFPQNPITPGVIELELVKELLEKVLSTEIRLVTIRNCKFVNILNPEKDAAVTVEMNCLRDESKLNVEATIQNPERSFLKLKAEYQTV